MIPGSTHSHSEEWYEVWANVLSADYHDSLGMSNVRTNFLNDPSNYPLTFTPNGYFAITTWYYAILFSLIL